MSLKPPFESLSLSVTLYEVDAAVVAPSSQLSEAPALLLLSRLLAMSDVRALLASPERMSLPSNPTRAYMSSISNPSRSEPASRGTVSSCRPNPFAAAAIARESSLHLQKRRPVLYCLIQPSDLRIPSFPPEAEAIEGISTPSHTLYQAWTEL